MLGSQLVSGAAGAAKDDRDRDLAAGHVQHLRGAVDDLIDGQHREVPGHHLDDRAQADHGRPDAQAGESLLGDRRVDDSLLAEPWSSPLLTL